MAKQVKVLIMCKLSTFIAIPYITLQRSKHTYNPLLYYTLHCITHSILQ